MEGNLADQTVRERIRDVEKAQSIAELKQIISNLEFQVGLKQMFMQLFSRMECIHQNCVCLYLKWSIFSEPAACKKFRGKGSVNESGGQDVKLETTGNSSLELLTIYKKSLYIFRPTTSSFLPPSALPSWSISCSSPTNKNIS